MLCPWRGRPVGPRRRGERGVATVLALGLMGVLLATAAVATAGTRVAVAAHRAAAAADLAALAGAQAVQGGAEPCMAADRAAGANGGSLTRCTQEGTEVVVTVEVETPTMVGLTWTLPASARAGPAGASDS